MFNIPFRCYDCKENLILPDGSGQSVKLKCDCIVGWCQACAKKSLLGSNIGGTKTIKDTSFLVCPICPDKILVKDTIELISEANQDSTKRESSRAIQIDDYRCRRNIFLEQCIEAERTGESNIGLVCIVCSVSFVEGNSVQLSCTCIHAPCQLCVRDIISRTATTYNDGSFKCPSNCINTGSIQNVEKAKKLEDDLLGKAWKTFMRTRPKKAFQTNRYLLLLLWVGIVYIPDILIEASNLDAIKMKNCDAEQQCNMIISTLESQLNAKLVRLLEFTMDVEQASIEMLRLEIARLYLWREKGGPNIPYGPLAALKVPRNRLLERWALKTLDGIRDSEGNMNIISSSDYYDIIAMNNNGTRIVLKASELVDVLLVNEGSKKEKQYLKKEEEYLRNYCQGPIHSALPVTLRTAQNNQPVEFEDDGDDNENDEDGESEYIVPFGGISLVPSAKPAYSGASTGSGSRSGLAVHIDLAVAHGLPAAYHGVVIQLNSSRQELSLKAAFMDGSYVPPDASSCPPPAALLAWWQQVAQAIRGSYWRSSIPEELKVALKDRMHMLQQDVMTAVDVGASSVDPASNAPPGKRACRRAVSVPVASSSSSSVAAGVTPDAEQSCGGGRDAPRLTEEEVRLLKAFLPLLQRMVPLIEQL